LVKGLSAALKDGVGLRRGLPAPDGDIYVEWVDLDTEGPPADPIRRQDRRAGSQKGVQNDITAAGTVPHRVRYQRYGFDGWMRRQVGHTPGAEGIGAGIGPNVRTVSSKTPELDVIQVKAGTDFEDKDFLVL
jgi:hypothetical protein